jgi:N-acetylglucosaminyl-diphospho-decaprenol L-rhamnosyltransferase
VAGSIHIVIVNWNTGRYLRQCLESIAAACRPGVTIARVTVVDNDSQDRSVDGLTDIELPLEVMRNRVNVGFATACNQGAAGSTADYLLFLNPDTRLFADTLLTVTRFMDGDQAIGIGICGAQIVDPNGGGGISCSRFPTLPVLVGKMTGLDHALPRLVPSHHLPPEETQESRFVDQVIGAFYFVRRELFTALGGFDARYFLYYEEVDFGLRAQQNGAATYFLKSARVLHAANISSDQVHALRLFHQLRSRRLYAYLHWPRWQAHLLVVLSLTVELLARLVNAALRRDASEIAATGAAYRRFVGELLGTASG